MLFMYLCSIKGITIGSVLVLIIVFRPVVDHYKVYLLLARSKNNYTKDITCILNDL